MTEDTQHWGKRQSYDMIPGFDGDLPRDWFFTAAMYRAMGDKDAPPIRHEALNTTFMAENFPQILAKMKEMEGRTVLINTDEPLVRRVSMVWDDAAADLNWECYSMYGTASLHMYTTNADRLEQWRKFFDDIREEVPVPPPSGSCHMLGNTIRGLQLFDLGHAGRPLVEANYSAKVMEAYKKIKQDLNSETPAGRFGVFTGPPGTGKTYLLRALMEEVQGVFVLVPSSMIESMGSPELVPTLLNLRSENGEQPIILVLEDGDAAMVKKTVSNASTISNMLNATSGILGDMMDLRILSTTNAANQELEPALLRAGRVSAHCEVGKLSPEEAQRAYDNLKTLEPFKPVEPMTLAEVYKTARARGWDPSEDASLFKKTLKAQNAKTRAQLDQLIASLDK